MKEKGGTGSSCYFRKSVRMSMSEVETMDVYLRAVREKMSELTAVVGLELEDDVKLAIILNVSNTQS